MALDSLSAVPHLPLPRGSNREMSMADAAHTSAPTMDSVSPRPTVVPSRAMAQAALEAVATCVRGKPQVIEAVMATVLARGHVLLEDVPGVGKTTLARAVARALGCDFQRIQFTSDLLPSDVVGVQVLDPQTGTLRFRKGPILAHLVLDDEINRASPKTQSALLEAMSDRQISVDNETHVLESPFSVIATQNPIEHHGAYPLPESQLDRFMVTLHMGYPPSDDERALLMDHHSANNALTAVATVLDPAGLRALQEQVQNVTLGPKVADYLLALVQQTRDHPEIHLGCSPRGALSWARLARAVAFLDGRDFVVPDDVKRFAGEVLVHRIALEKTQAGAAARLRAQAIVDDIVATVSVPR